MDGSDPTGAGRRPPVLPEVLLRRASAPCASAPGGAAGRPSPGFARAGAGRFAPIAAWGGILVQLLYPALDGVALRAATLGSVALFAVACAAHVLALHGPAVALRVITTACGIGLVLETIGLRTGFPFGSYTYSASLGPQVFGVPLIVPLAWLTISWPCLVLARRPAGGAGGGLRGRARTASIGAAGMAAWDLFWDPQLVAAGHWTWSHPHPGLPGVDGVPLTNAVGWLLGGFLLTALLDLVVPRSRPEDRAEPRRRRVRAGEGGRGRRLSVRGHDVVPALLLTWTWAGSVLANLVFFGEPALAGYGALALGATVLPYLRSLAGEDAPAPPGGQTPDREAPSPEPRDRGVRGGAPGGPVGTGTGPL
ncbi:MAG: hypothetical protein QG608_2216 [Actinomycetota bacterium]|nr:hypothetical protein [Actinomycetota bacterium]